MDENPTVSVNEGKVCGVKDTSKFSGVEYYAFYGVPYGQSTDNDRRFKDPVKVEPWDGVYDATLEKGGCAQFSLRRFMFLGSEDCLYTNIYTNKLPSEKDEPLRPVIVNLHPGGLMYGSPDTSHYGSPDLVMHNDVVYVCIAHRLHILGFLNLGIEECAGNQGLKDIIMGLEWLKENIHVFSGDPGNVTLIGSSSGCELIHLLMLMPAAKGLFHKAVMMGMYAFNPSLYRRSDRMESEKAAIEIARGIGYSGKDTNSLLAFLKKAPISVLITEFRSFQKDHQRFAQVFQSGIFHPTVDEGKNAVLPVPPRDLIGSMARIPIIFGICDRESIVGFCLSNIFSSSPSICGILKKKMDKYALSSYRQNEWGWGYHLTDGDVKQITKKAESFYTKGSSLNKASLSTKVDFQTDVGFSDVYGTLLDVVSKDLPSSVFVYKFQFEGCVRTMKYLLLPLLDEPLDGTYHAADYEYWARMDDVVCANNLRQYDKRTSNFIKKFTKLICTFARTGDPNYEGLEVQWAPSTPENPCHLVLNDEMKMIDDKLNGDRMRFWENLREEYTKN